MLLCCGSRMGVGGVCCEQGLVYTLCLGSVVCEFTAAAIRLDRNDKVTRKAVQRARAALCAAKEE